MESEDDDDYPVFSRRNRRRGHRFKPGQHISDRIDRALSQDLRLLRRRGSTFSISGSTGNSYTVRLSSTPSCTCPDLVTPCKHILFVFIRVLGASIDDVCPRRGTLQPYQLQRLLSLPTSPETVVGDTLSQSFDDEEEEGSDGTSIEVEDGATEEEGSSGTSIEMEDGATRPILDRINRALSQPLCLLHRCGSTFSILGSAGNAYTVSLSSTPSCTCPDIVTPCKHILFVFIRVLGASIDDVCLRRGTLRPGQLQRLLSMPTLPETAAGATLRQRFHQELFVGRGGSNGTSIEMEDGATGQGRSNETSIEMEDGATCPVCLEEMGKEEKLVVCGRCRNPIHEECLLRWKRTKGRKSATCVICRASWRD